MDQYQRFSRQKVDRIDEPKDRRTNENGLVMITDLENQDYKLTRRTSPFKELRYSTWT